MLQKHIFKIESILLELKAILGLAEIYKVTSPIQNVAGILACHATEAVAKHTNIHHNAAGAGKLVPSVW